MKVPAALFAALALFFVSGHEVSAQIHENSVEIYFRVGSSRYEPSFRGNGARLSEFTERFNSLIDTNSCIRYEVEIVGGASPDGRRGLNERLAGERLASARAALEKAGINASFIGSCYSFAAESEVTDWSRVAEAVSADASAPRRDETLKVLNDTTLTSAETERRLKALRGGVWKYLTSSVLPEWRSCRAVVRCRTRLSAPALDAGFLPRLADNLAVSPYASKPIAVPPARTSASAAAALSENDDWTRKLTVKTNALGLALLIGNAAAEIDITRNLSFSLPVYYSALNYFTSTIKFRTFAVQPELRWNFTKPDGLFVGAHFGLAYFNLATNGNWRIQTHDGNKPLIGGGLSVGYKLPISKDKKWNVEFVLGAGAYRFHYDKFYNEPNGALAGSVRRTYIGLDNAGVSFSYSFDLGRGRRQ